MRMPLRAKLGLGFGMLVAFMCVMAIAGSGLILRTKNYSEQTNVEIPKLVVLFDLQNSFDRSARALRDDAYANRDNMNDVEKQEYNEGKQNFMQSLDKLSKMVSSRKGREIFNQFKRAGRDTFALMDEAMALAVDNKNAEARNVILNKIVAPQDRMLALFNNYAEFQRQRTKQNAQLVTSSSASGCAILLVLGASGLILGALLAGFISRSITKPLNHVVKGLMGSSTQVSAASAQVSSASHVLAEGASEQAASIQDTSSSLEEMSSMTKQNADHAGQSNQLANEARETLTRAMGNMEKLTTSMADMSKASEETSKIIKTIDEIAFQTNLLALNAAVEAARAGEAGAGFAVVADEVRNLAMRAASASENTTTLIEGTIKKIKEGADLVLLTNDGFREVAASAAKSGELISEISAASKEQAQGIESINAAVSKMEQVVERNAANAEECASASEEMNMQAGQLKEFLSDLVALVGGNANKNGKNETARHAPSREVAKKAMNCWEFLKCGREAGGAKAKELGVCPAYPDHGRQCARLVGTLCGGKVQGSHASKITNCMKCAFYKSGHYDKTGRNGSHDQPKPGNGKALVSDYRYHPEQVIPFDTDVSEF